MPLQPSLPFDLDFEAHNNNGLFADHYLNNPERLKNTEEWQRATGIEEAFEQIDQLYAQRVNQFTARTNEAQTERDFIRPVLDLLWGATCYDVEVRIPTVNGQRQPDYAFFRTADVFQAAKSLRGTMDYWRDVSCLGDAKRWTVSLDKKWAADENPSAQICNYLYRSRVRWSILTNGRIWRLYEREKSSAGGIFYEINLEELLKRGNLEAFKYFYLFFRREAFVPDSTGVTFVEKVFRGSVDYAAEVGDRLKESVYDALRLLMNGFFEHSANGLDRHDPDTVKAVHENCLIVLYRLLFLLYAEDRDLLPCSTGPYADYSVYHLQREINQHLCQAGNTYLPVAQHFWGAITDLFALIDRGFPEGGIPAYNGGLFSPVRYPRITQWKIGDHRLAEVIDMLAYQREKWDQPGTQDIDYTTLDVQHLGSIYEGLLELQPRIAAEAMVETIADGKPIFKPQREVANPRPIRGQPPRMINADEVYLVTNRGERKATGSYYTPKYIVDYIVENTLGPLADEASKQVAALRPGVDKEIKKLKKILHEWEKTEEHLSPPPNLPHQGGGTPPPPPNFPHQGSGTPPPPPNLHHQGGGTGSPPLVGGVGGGGTTQISNLNKAIEEQKHRLLEPYLTLNVLDPAMGSGHFLVGAADFLSLAMATDPNLLHLEEMDDEDPQIFYKRLIVERCLYGVDLNPLAVELAKLSLWLHTVSKDKALSFLDHHLRCGNSLIGARIEADLMTEPPRFNARGKRVKADSQQLVFGFTQALSATHLHYFLDTFRKIMEAPSGDAEMERMKDRLYWEMDRVRDKFRAVANCWLAPYFGVPVTPEYYERAVRTLRGTDPEWQTLAREAWFQDAQTVAENKRFFHWELEFPEIFFDAYGFKSKEERGFDATISNPPYVDIKGLEKEMVKYLFESYSTTRLRINVFASFLERALKIVSIRDGTIGFIIPTAFLTQESYDHLRQLTLDRCWLKSLVRLPNELFGDVAGDVKVDTCIVIIHPSRDLSELTTDILIYDTFERIHNISHDTASTVLEIPQREWMNKKSSAITFVKREESHIIDRMRSQSERLENCCEFCLGLTPYDKYAGHTEEEIRNKVFHAKSQIDPTYKKLLRSGDVRRYEVKWNGDDWIKYGQWLAAPREQRFFTQERILVQQIIDWSSLRIFAGWTDEELYNSQNQFNLLSRQETNLKFILSILNSKLMSYYHRRVFLDVAIQRFQKILIKDAKTLPIYRIAFTTPEDERIQLVDKARQLYENYLSQGNTDPVLDFVKHQLAQTPERADVIHDLLAFLAEQMITMNKEKQEELTGFLRWLERQIGAKVDDLSNKTTIRAYHEHDLDTLLGILRKNRRKLDVNPTTRAVQEPIETEFSASMTKLIPLKARIAATDRLIDLIVYRLYGLTEEEVALVEGGS